MKHQSIIDKLSLREKCSLLSGRDIWSTHPFPHANIPSIYLSDGPSGLRKQVGASDHLGLNASQPATCWPSGATVANSWDTELALKVGTAIGIEAREQNVNVVLGPGLNIKRTPLCGRNFEYFSEDPYLSGKLAGAYIRGIQSNGVAACPKHFVANSQELRRMSSDSVVDERTLREIYLTGFEIAVKEGNPKSIMSAYNLINGSYANESKKLLRDILVDEWGFDGAVVTDWGGCNDFVDGIEAGSHLEMPGTGGDSARQLILAVEEGRISEETINERVDELLNLILSTSKDLPYTKASAEEHHSLACEVAKHSHVLLKNDGNLLPLNPSCKVAIIGDFAKTPRYQGAGSSMVNPTQIDNTLNLLSNYFPNNTGYEQGFLRSGEEREELVSQAVELAARSEAVLLYLGLPEVAETEGLDRLHMRLPKNQLALVERLEKVCPNIVVVLSAGSAVELPFLQHCKALLYCGLSGQAGAAATLELLSGKISPSGKLSETYPISYEDTPAAAYYPATARHAYYREGIYVGYRYYDTADKSVNFPFGFGLSYTSFQYSDLLISPTEATFTITNTGAMDGSEVCQLYVSLKDAKIFRPKQELKGFKKVFLYSGESKKVTISFDEMTFRYFNVETDRFEVEGGEYIVSVGGDSRNLPLVATLDVVGTDAPNPYLGLELTPYYTGEVTEIPDAMFELLLGRLLPTDELESSSLLKLNDPLSRMSEARSGLARLACRILRGKMEKSLMSGKPDLNLLFLYNMPFRAIAKMTGGVVTTNMASSILTLVNGRFFRGVGGIIGGYFTARKQLKEEMKWRKSFEEENSYE